MTPARAVSERWETIERLFKLDGVPLDRATAIALVNFGVNVLIVTDVEREVIAHLLEQAADNVRANRVIPVK